MWSALGKYKAIVVSIALFLLLDASVLILNFYISFKIADDAVGVNVAGRQRMLSQRTVKTLLNLEDASNATEQRLAFNELKNTYDLFNQTLIAFEFGGVTTGANGQPVTLKPVKSLEAKQAIGKAKKLWKPYSNAIKPILDSPGQLDGIALQNAIIQARHSNIELLTLMNQLTVALETDATNQAMILRYVQAGGISLAIINFLIILFHFIGELKRNDKALEMSRQETTNILNTVNEGLFLLDEDLHIGSQHSAKLSALFGGKKVVDQSFSKLIGDLVKPKDLETAERFISLLFRPDIKSNLIGDLNPLNEVEINLPDGDGGYLTQYLSFDFTRVMEEDELTKILVTVNDITARVKLTQQLAQEKERGEQQLEMLTSILHTDPLQLKRFLDHAFVSFDKVNNVLKEQTKGDTALQRKLNDIFIEIHTFKGEASAMGLEPFADLAHNFEEDIQYLKNQDKLTGNDLLKLTVALESLIRYSESVQGLAEKLASFSVLDGASTNKTIPARAWTHLNTLSEQTAERNGKQVHLVTTGFNETQLDKDTETLVNELSIQFIRNAIVHSIETPAFRMDKGKASIGRIDARLVKLPSGQLELSVRDDGNGIDYEKIRAKAISLNRWNESAIGQWSKKQLLSCIFEPGFSTAEATTKDAGRGVGMDVIKRRIKARDGHLRVTCHPGRDCMFTATLPLPQQQSAVA